MFIFSVNGEFKALNDSVIVEVSYRLGRLASCYSL